MAARDLSCDVMFLIDRACYKMKEDLCSLIEKRMLDRLPPGVDLVPSGFMVRGNPGGEWEEASDDEEEPVTPAGVKLASGASASPDVKVSVADGDPLADSIVHHGTADTVCAAAGISVLLPELTTQVGQATDMARPPTTTIEYEEVAEEVVGAPTAQQEITFESMMRMGTEVNTESDDENEHVWRELSPTDLGESYDLVDEYFANRNVPKTTIEYEDEALPFDKPMFTGRSLTRSHIEPITYEDKGNRSFWLALQDFNDLEAAGAVTGPFIYEGVNIDNAFGQQGDPPAAITEEKQKMERKEENTQEESVPQHVAMGQQFSWLQQADDRYDVVRKEVDSVADGIRGGMVGTRGPNYDYNRYVPEGFYTEQDPASDIIKGIRRGYRPTEVETVITGVGKYIPGCKLWTPPPRSVMDMALFGRDTSQLPSDLNITGNKAVSGAGMRSRQSRSPSVSGSSVTREARREARERAALREFAAKWRERQPSALRELKSAVKQAKTVAEDAQAMAYRAKMMRDTKKHIDRNPDPRVMRASLGSVTGPAIPKLMHIMDKSATRATLLHKKVMGRKRLTESEVHDIWQRSSTFRNSHTQSSGEVGFMERFMQDPIAKFHYGEEYRRRLPANLQVTELDTRYAPDIFKTDKQYDMTKSYDTVYTQANNMLPVTIPTGVKLHGHSTDLLATLAATAGTGVITSYIVEAVRGSKGKTPAAVQEEEAAGSSTVNTDKYVDSEDEAFEREIEELDTMAEAVEVLDEGDSEALAVQQGDELELVSIRNDVIEAMGKLPAVSASLLFKAVATVRKMDMAEIRDALARFGDVPNVAEALVTNARTGESLNSIVLS
jgi:hypothetical protein